MQLRPTDSTVFLYDGTFEGLLSVVFEGFRMKIQPVRITPEEEHQESLFDAVDRIETNAAKANRVYAGVKSRTDTKTARFLYRCFLSEAPDVEMLLYNFIRQIFTSEENPITNYADDTVRRLNELNNQMGREIHRMHAFVRFQRTADDLYFAVVEPDFNVLPLIGDHFEDRYADQRWLIYDTKRRYGLHYDLQRTEYITFAEANHLQFRQLSADILNHQEGDYQNLWRAYFDAVDIPERRNIKLHLQHVPKRYWKYLTEK